MIVAKLPKATVAAFQTWHRAQPPNGSNWSWPIEDENHRGRILACAHNLQRSVMLRSESEVAYQRGLNPLMKAAAQHWDAWAVLFTVLLVELGTARQPAQEAA